MKTAQRANFRSAEYLDAVFRLAEGLVLDQRERAELGKRYERAMEIAGLEQRELGDLIGYSDRQIRNYLQGNVENAMSPARKWAEACGVSYDWLITGNGSPVAPADSDRLGRIEELLGELLVEIQAMRDDDESAEAQPTER